MAVTPSCHSRRKRLLTHSENGAPAIALQRTRFDLIASTALVAEQLKRSTKAPGTQPSFWRGRAERLRNGDSEPASAGMVVNGYMRYTGLL